MSKYRKVLEKQSTLLQPIEDFEQFSIMLLRINKQTKDCLTFIQKEYRRRWNEHKTFIIVSFVNSFNCLTIFIHSN